MNKVKIKYAFLCLIMFLLIPISASANMVWPALYITKGMMSWYVILTGFIIEIIFVKIFLKESILKSILIAFVMNLASTLIGVVAIPLGGILEELIMSPFFYTFHITHWIISYIITVLINTVIEGTVIKLVFKKGFKNIFWWLFAANAISVIICILYHGIEMQNINL